VARAPIGQTPRRGERHCDSVTTAVSTPTAKKRWDDAERDELAVLLELAITRRSWWSPLMFGCRCRGAPQIAYTLSSIDMYSDGCLQ
jgi:hypothetical protein